jgi:hypothetical protein
VLEELGHLFEEELDSGAELLDCEVFEEVLQDYYVDDVCYTQQVEIL